MKPTQYLDINNILHLLKEGLVDLLGENLVGLYLTGSLTYGDFDRGSSDIDFLAVLDHRLSKEKLQEVRKVHNRIGKMYPKWHKRIEGSYITKKMLSNIKPPKQPRPYVNAGKMWNFKYGFEWILNLYQLYEYGIVLEGPDPKKILQTLSIDEVIDASRKNLLREWKPKLKESGPFENEDYDRNHLQAYAVLSMCRILYTEKKKEVSSKKTASRWAKKAFGKLWKRLIEKAENWKHGDEMNSEKETLDFIKFTIDEVTKKKGRLNRTIR